MAVKGGEDGSLDAPIIEKIEGNGESYLHSEQSGPSAPTAGFLGRLESFLDSLTVGKRHEDRRSYGRWHRLLLTLLLTCCASIDPIASTSYYRQMSSVIIYR